MFKNHALFAAATAMATLFAFPAYATKNVTSPYVTEGESEIEWKGGYEIDDEDDDAWEMETSYAYGVTSFWETEIGVSGEDAGDDEDAEFSALTWENKFQLAPKGALWVDPGLKLEYERSLQGGPDEIKAKFILAKQIDKFKNKANFNVSREVGDDSENDLEYGLSYMLAYDYSEDFQFGVEWYSDFGDFDDDFDDQGHQFGPVIYGDAFGGLVYEAGILAGVSESAPDALVKVIIGYEF